MAAGDVDVSISKVRAFECANFDGVDDYIEIPHRRDFIGEKLTNGFTISAWIRPHSSGEGTAGRIFDKSDGTTAENGFMFYMSSSNRVQFIINAGSSKNSATNGVMLADGNWYHVVITHNDSNSRFYVNGTASLGSTTSAGTLASITTTSVMRIGQRSGGTDRTFDGQIMKVRFFNRVLTAAEVLALYNGEVPSGQIGFWKLDKDAKDYGPMGLDGTTSGANYLKQDDTASVAVKALRDAATDKWLLTGISGGQVLIARTKEA